MGTPGGCYGIEEIWKKKERGGRWVEGLRGLQFAVDGLGK